MQTEAITAVNDLRVKHILSMAGDGTTDFNCWGASLYVLGEQDRLRWVEVKEMSEWIRDKTEKVKTPAVGDILTLYDELPFGKLLVHTAVCLGNNKYLHKLGQQRAEIASLQTVRKHYYYCTDKYEIRRMT